MNDHSSGPPDPSDAGVEIYLREIGEVPVLTPGEELILARRTREGDLAARTRLLRAQLPLVVSVAREYSGKGLPLLDLITAGNFGLIHAVNRFDPESGGSLAALMDELIRRGIGLALAGTSVTEPSGSGGSSDGRARNRPDA